MTTSEKQKRRRGSRRRRQYVNRKKKKFLSELAASSHVSASAKAAKIPVSTVYYWRDTDPEFCAAWLKALAAGYEMLEMTLLEQAREGVDKNIYFGGKHVDTVKEFNHNMALKILAAHKEMVGMTRAVQAEIGDGGSDIRIRLDQKLNDMRGRLKAKRAIERKSGAIAAPKKPSQGCQKT